MSYFIALSPDESYDPAFDLPYGSIQAAYKEIKDNLAKNYGTLSKPLHTEESGVASCQVYGALTLWILEIKEV